MGHFKQILSRRGTEAQWKQQNPVLGLGEIAFSTDRNMFKVGDGVWIDNVLVGSHWKDLSYVNDPTDPMRVSEYDDFAGGVTDNQLGDLAWSGSADAKAAEEGHPGILTISANNAVSSIYCNSIYSTDVILMRAIVRPVSGTATMSFRFGLLQDHEAAGETGRGVYFSYNPAQSIYWRAVTRDGVDITVTDTAVEYTEGTWFLLEVFQIGTDFHFFVDGVQQAVHSTNIPAESTNPSFTLESNEAVEKSLDVDFFGLATKSTGR